MLAFLATGEQVVASKSGLTLLAEGHSEGRPSALPWPPAHPLAMLELFPGAFPAWAPASRSRDLWHLLILKVSSGSAAGAPGCGLHSLAGGCWDLRVPLPGTPTPCTQAGPRRPPALSVLLPTSWPLPIAGRGFLNAGV